MNMFCFVFPESNFPNLESLGVKGGREDKPLESLFSDAIRQVLLPLHTAPSLSGVTEWHASKSCHVVSQQSVKWTGISVIEKKGSATQTLNSSLPTKCPLIASCDISVKWFQKYRPLDENAVRDATITGVSKLRPTGGLPFRCIVEVCQVCYSIYLHCVRTFFVTGMLSCPALHT